MWLMSNQNGPWPDPNMQSPRPVGQPGAQPASNADSTWILPAQGTPGAGQVGNQPGQPTQGLPAQGQPTHGQPTQQFGQPAVWGSRGGNGVHNPPVGTDWGYQQQPTGQQQVGQPAQPPVWGAAPTTPVKRDNPLGALFDFSFTQYATPALVKIVYVLTVVAGMGSWLFSVLGAFAFSSMMRPFGGGDPVGGVVALLFGWIPAVLFIALVRFMLEFYLATVRTNERVEQILEQMRSEPEGEES